MNKSPPSSSRYGEKIFLVYLCIFDLYQLELRLVNLLVGESVSVVQ